jgi:glycosyltransferase involved in cell wall biosynthesis
MFKAHVGVVVPTLNSAATLDWTLCALRNQRGISTEIIVADSGSVDGTLEICKKWSVPVTYVPPGNIYRAINLGLRQLQTEWVAELNSDDFVHPHSYSRLVACGEQQRVDLVYGDCDFVDAEGRFLFTDRSAPQSRSKGIFRCGRFGFQPMAAVFRKRAFDDLGGFDEKYSLVADADFFSRLVLSGRPVAKVNAPAVAAFRLHERELSVWFAAEMAIEKKLRRSALPRPSVRDFFDLAYWRLQNLPSHLINLFKHRNLRRTLHSRAAQKSPLFLDVAERHSD